jgi:hypothetical protein
MLNFPAYVGQYCGYKRTGIVIEPNATPGCTGAVGREIDLHWG